MIGEILSDRVTIATEIYDLLVEGTQNWGVSVKRVEVKDVRVPEQLVAAMAAEAQAARDARGKVGGHYVTSKPFLLVSR